MKMPRLRKLLSALGSSYADDPTVADFKPTKGKDLRREFGATGTLNFEGYLTDIDEYNDDFKVNDEGFKIYEQMRRGDPQVFALLAALGLPIRSARWDVEAPEVEPQAVEQEAADLVRENLFGGLEYTSPIGIKVSQSWDSVLSHALLMLPFGSAAVEEVWALDGDTIRLARLDPRMPRTYWRWHVDSDGETLVVLEQIAYRGSEMEFWKIPADKLTVFSFQKEGAYFAGRSMLRAVYKPWFFKCGLEKIETIAAERNGMGFPVLTHGENASEEDRARGNQWITQIATHEAIGLGLPAGSDFKLVGVSGQTYNITPSIQRFSQEITRAGLASFLDLGTTETGARSVGDTLSEFFYTSEQSLAESICWHMNTGVIRRMVDFNYPGMFGRGRLRYPRLTAANVQARSIVALIQYLDKLATASLIRPDDTLEDDLRRQMGLPAPDKKTSRIAQQVKPTAKLDSIPGMPQSPAAPGTPARSTPSAPAAAPASTPGAAPHAAPAAKPAPAPAHMSAVKWGGVTLPREPRGPEVHVQFADVISRLDGGKKAVARELRKAKPKMLGAITQKLAASGAANAHRVSLPLDESLSGRVEQHLRKVYDFGRQTVKHEMAAQRRGAKPPEKPQLVKASGAAGDADGADRLKLLADTTVGQFQNQLTARAASASLAAKRKAPPPPPEDVAEDVDGQPDGWIDRAAGEAANNAISSGRQDEFHALRADIDRFVYSALLDENTCEECQDDDGKEGTENEIPAVPNPDCAGGDQCRCMWVAVFKDEGGSA